MAAIGNTTSAVATSSNNTVTLAVPAGATTADCFLIAVDYTDPTGTVTWPSGFTEIAVHGTEVTHGSSLRAAIKPATGSEAGNFVATLSGFFLFTAVCAVVQGVGSTLQTSSANAPGGNFGSSVSLTGASVTTGAPNNFSVFIGGIVGDGTASVATFTQPTSFTKNATVDTGLGYALGLASFTEPNNGSVSYTGSMAYTAAGTHTPLVLTLVFIPPPLPGAITGAAAATAAATGALVTGIRVVGDARATVTAAAGLTRGPYRAARVNVSIPKVSFDGLYWGRYPQGNKPQSLGADAGIAMTVAGILTGSIPSAPADPVTGALNATGTGTRYDVHTAAAMDTTPWATLGPGDVVNIFNDDTTGTTPTTYARKFGLRCQGTAANPVIINGVTDTHGNRPIIGGTFVTTCPSCNPSGGFTGATDIFHVPAGQYNGLGMITIMHGPQDTYISFVPKYFKIQNLDITGAQPNNQFTDIFTTTPQNWTGAGAGGIWFQRGDQFVVNNCRLYDNGFGFFTMCKGDGDTADTPNILIECATNGTFTNNKTFGNGVLTSSNQSVHGWYMQGGPHTVMGNYIGQNRPGSAGSSYKSRLPNEIFAYNYVVATARAIDWVQTEDNNLIRSIPGYGATYAFGNTILNDLSLPAGGAGANPIHYGCDNTGEDNPTAGTLTAPLNPWATGSFWLGNVAGQGDFKQPRLQLYFWNNTVINRTPGSTFYKIHLFDASLQSTLIDCRDNIFVMDGAGLHASWMEYAGRLNVWGRNLLYYLNGAAPLLNVDYNYDAAGGAQVGIGANGGTWWTVNIANAPIVGNPLFVNYAGNDFRLSAGSPAIGQAAGAFPGGMTFPPTCGFYAPSGAPRSQSGWTNPSAFSLNQQFALNNQQVSRATATDLGAFGSASTLVAGSASAAVSATAALTTGSGVSAFVIYANGVENALWNFNLSFGNAVSLTDTTHVQSPHTQALKIPAGGAWQYGTTNFGGSNGFDVGPYGLDISAYTKLSLDLYTAFPTHQFDIQAHYDGNISAGGADVATPTYLGQVQEVFGALTGNVYNTNITVALSILGQLGIVAAYKFYLRDNNNNDSWWDNIKLLTGNLSWIYSGGQARTWVNNTTGYSRDASTPLNGWADASVNAAVVYNQSPAALSVICAATGLANPGKSTASCDVAKVTPSAANSQWKLTHAGFALAGYTTLTVALLPTAAGYAFTVQFLNTSGVAVGNAVDPYANTNHDWGIGGSFWTVSNMPLSAFGSLPASVGGLIIKDTSGHTNVYYGSALGFFS